MKNKTSVYIIGASGFGREVESWTSLSADFLDQYLIKGYLDDNLEALTGFPSDYKVVGKIDTFRFKSGDHILLGIADPNSKKDVFNRLKSKVHFLSFLFANIIVGKNVKVGEGTIIGPNCVLSSNIDIGQFVTINVGTTVGHDSIISDFSSVMGHVNINGGVKIGKSVYVGSNSTITVGKKIDDGSKIESGSVVIDNLPNYSEASLSPVMTISNLDGEQKIWLSPPHMGGTEQKYIQDAFNSNWISTVGPNVEAFENSIVRYCQIAHAAALSSGTAAIHLALILIGVERGDEVIASTFTFSATVNPIAYLGATPVLVDSEPNTWNMCPDTLEIAIKARLSKGKKPKAIIPVHIYGMPANMERIMEIANNYEIPVVEDAAEAMGSHYKNKTVGSIGEIGILSFNGNKIITTSGGGAIISNDESLINEARFLSKQARDIAPYYQHSHVGYNYRMSNVLAGIGLGQMEVLETRIIQRRDCYNFYKKNLEKFEGITFQMEPDKTYFSNRWLTTILIDRGKTGKSWQELQKALERENIESRPLWKPMHLQPVFSSCPAYLNGTSESLFLNGICLPSGSNMTGEDRMRVLHTINKFLIG